MPTRMYDPVETLRREVLEAVGAIRGESAEPAADPVLARPKRAGQGDYSTNAAMLVAASLGGSLVRYEVAGPGFVNLVLSDDWHRDALAAVLAAGDSFGAGGAPVRERILLEFVSANPTGELVAASGRHAAYGDALARILTHHGHDVAREYYFNDAGGQIRLLGESVRARALGEEVPEGGYQGDYVRALADVVPGVGDPSVDVAAVAAGAVEILLARIKATLTRYGVMFDTF